jgi:membrane protein
MVRSGTTRHVEPAPLTEFDSASWRYTFRKAVLEFQRDECTDQAAALTYYAVLSLFPALLALVSLLGVFGQGQSTTNTMVDLVRSMGQEKVADQLRGPIEQMTQAHGAGITLVVGLAGALWSASGYVGAFGRSMNRIYGIQEGRPFWKLRPLQVGITLVGVILSAVVLLGLVLSGPVARSVGDALGLGSAALTTWNIVKWPMLLAIVVVLVALLYYATPNVRKPKFRWVSAGAAIAILAWIVISAAFGFYVAHFGSYNKTYGSLAGVIVFLLWLWITNLALLLGAEVDAEVERAALLRAGAPVEEELGLEPRDSSAAEKREEKVNELSREGRRIRRRAGSG